MSDDIRKQLRALWWESRPGLFSLHTGTGRLVVNAATGAAAFYFTIPAGDVDAMLIAAEDVVDGPEVDGHPASNLRRLLEIPRENERRMRELDRKHEAERKLRERGRDQWRRR